MMLGIRILFLFSLTSLGQCFPMFIPGSESQDLNQVIHIHTTLKIKLKFSF